MSTKLEKATVLAIGTELTTGQITNRNAAWLSEQLSNMGIETVAHETVADERTAILSALDRCRSLSGLIFVTGGLGPTTDDFTRDVIAEWLGKPLKFYEPSWLKIRDRLTRLGVPVAESNRQQAFYPETAEIIVNEQGTADAFAVGSLFVLPGPPREVESVWQSGIQARVRALVPHLKPQKLLTWQCIGKSEAELGEITEKALAGSLLKTGYRAHRPYVEVKVWCTDEDMRTKAPYIRALDQAIGPWVATRQGKDLAERLLALLGRTEEVEVADACSGGILAERLGVFLREPSHRSQADSVIVTTEWMRPHDPGQWIRQVLEEADDSTITLAIAGQNEAGDWAFGLRDGRLLHVETSQSPYRKSELHDRARRYAVELALKKWCEWLEAATQ